MLLNVIQNLLLTPVHYLNRIKTNITHAISKKKARAHVNERNVLNYIMFPVLTKKLRHVFGNKSLVNPYQKPQQLINRLIELFSNPDEWVLDQFSGIGI